jgi:flagellar hook-length control protein FliK
MDIALPALAVVPLPPASPATEATELATDAAFAALLASLVAATAPLVPLQETAPALPGTPTATAALSGGDAGALLAQSQVQAEVPTGAPADAPAITAPVVADAGARPASLVAVDPRPLIAPGTTADDVGTGDVADAALADGGRDRTRPAAERVVANPVAPPESARLLASAVPASATVSAAAMQADDVDADVAAPPATAAAAVEVAAEVRPAEATKAPAPATPVRPAEQIVRIVAPLRAAPDGTYELGLELRPEGLGRVRLDVVVERGVVHVAMRAETDAAMQLLNRSLGELRLGLADAGLEAGRLGVQTDVRDGGRHAAPDRSDTPADRRHGGPGHEPQADDRPPTAPAYADARRGGVDLFL